MNQSKRIIVSLALLLMTNGVYAENVNDLVNPDHRYYQASDEDTLKYMNMDLGLDTVK